MRAATKEGFRCNVRLKVHFIGEEAEDEGGPLREFFCLALRAVCNNSGILQGADDRKTFSCNPLLLQRSSYFCAGLITGMSLQQGGPGLHCLSPAVYEHLTGGAALATPVLQDVADFDSKMRIEKVECKIPLSLCHYEVEGLSDRQKKSKTFQPKSIFSSLMQHISVSKEVNAFLNPCNIVYYL